jgi:hypothetical protein
MLSSIVLALAGVLATPAQAQTMSISVIHPDPVLTAVGAGPGRFVGGDD